MSQNNKVRQFIRQNMLPDTNVILEDFSDGLVKVYIRIQNVRQWVTLGTFAAILSAAEEIY